MVLLLVWLVCVFVVVMVLVVFVTVMMVLLVLVLVLMVLAVLAVSVAVVVVVFGADIVRSLEQASKGGEQNMPRGKRGVAAGSAVSVVLICWCL